MVSPRNIRFALALLVTTAIVGIVAAISMKGLHTTLPEPVSQQLPQNIDVALHHARFTEMREGTTVWELVADRAEYDKTGDVAYLSDVHMVFTKTRTSGAITATAAKGEYSTATRNVRLRGKVHVVTESGMVFDTESLDYLAEPALFRTSEHIDFKQARLSLSAIGMELNVKSETSRFFRSIDAVVKGVATH
ncbi:MAG: LPS export ABC transporter periplasmic protein LptC [Geobacteraceae bacterium]|nr:LPS export ABC transporter periplasmic protein LptC [Geobacteraceae bacterium]